MSAHLGRIIPVLLVTLDTNYPIIPVWLVALAEVHVKPVQQLHHGGMALLVLNVLVQATVRRGNIVIMEPVRPVQRTAVPHVLVVLLLRLTGMAVLVRRDA